MFKHCFHYVFPVGFVLAKCRKWLHEGNGTVELIYRCSVLGFGSVTMYWVRSAKICVLGFVLPICHSTEPFPRKLRGAGERTNGSDLFMFCSYQSQPNKASRFHRSLSRCRMLPNAVARPTTARCGLRGPDVASLIRATHPGYGNWCGY